MTDDLNPPQREAVEHVSGPLLVFAGAGSGKTKCITHRTANLVLRHGVPPGRILLVTFTNKAANEMKERLVPLIGLGRVKQLWAGTFHAICARILRQHAAAVGRRRDFVIYDDSDQETVVKQIFGEMKIDKKMFSPSRMLARIQDAKQRAYAPGDIPQIDPETTQLVEVWDRYDAWLRNSNAMDFEDLILLTMRLAEGSHPAIGAMLRSAFDYLLVDEFQDTNFTQYRLVKALARASGNLCVVGDDDQCLAGSTEVLMSGDVTRPIVAIVPGDEVLSLFHGGHVRPNRVMAVTQTKATEALYVQTDAAATWLRCTPNHPLYVFERTLPPDLDLRGRDRIGSVRSVRAEYLTAGMELLRMQSSGGAGIGYVHDGVRIAGISRVPADGEVFYDLSLEDPVAPNFFANGLLVHNCIYTWRGADPRNIRDFQAEWPNAKIVRLEQNYRSTKRIVACAVGVIQKNQLRVDKTLWTANPAGGEVEIVESPSDRGEADVVCARIRGALARGARASAMAVLYRTHTQSRAIEDQLRDWQVPYRIVGGHRFYDRKEVKDVLAYLRLLSNQDSDVDILRVLNVPARGLGPTTLKRLSEIASSRATGLWAAIPLAEQAPEIGRKERLQLGAFRDVIAEFQKTARSERPSVLTARLIDGIGYRKMWEREAARLTQEGKHSEAEEAQARVENLDEIVNAVAAYEARAAEDGEAPSLHGYLEVVSLAAEESKDEKADRVLLMTVHAAKGLEFDDVFLVGFEEGRFPMKGVDMNPQELEEERRIAYVAITRARLRLCITMSRCRWVRGTAEACSPSRFLADMPATAIRRGDAREAPPSPENKKGWL